MGCDWDVLSSFGRGNFPRLLTLTLTEVPYVTNARLKTLLKGLPRLQRLDVLECSASSDALSDAVTSLPVQLGRPWLTVHFVTVRPQSKAQRKEGSKGAEFLKASLNWITPRCMRVM